MHHVCVCAEVAQLSTLTAPPRISSVGASLKACCCTGNVGIDIPADPSNPEQPGGWGVESKICKKHPTPPRLQLLCAAHYILLMMECVQVVILC